MKKVIYLPLLALSGVFLMMLSACTSEPEKFKVVTLSKNVTVHLLSDTTSLTNTKTNELLKSIYLNPMKWDVAKELPYGSSNKKDSFS